MLAAVKLLLHPDLAEEVGTKVPTLSEERKEALNQLPIIRETREGGGTISDSSTSKALPSGKIMPSQSTSLKYIKITVSVLRESASRPSSGVFEGSLTTSRRNLEKSQRKLSAGYDGSEKLLRIAGTVLTIAEDLYNEMERKHTPENEKKHLTVDD